jgi:DNA repair protein RecN (Recombination protein N)
LIVIHGQHDSLRLRSGREALRLLDQYGDVHDDDYQSVLSRIRDLERSRATYGGDPSARAREIEFLRFQLAEIEAVAPSSPEELTVVLERLRTLSVLRDHHDDLRAAVTTIDGDDDDTSLAQLARGLRRIPDEGHLGQIRQRLDELAQEIRELVRELSRETDEWQLDPGEETSLEIRAAALQQLARKYGGSLADALVQRDEITRSLLDHDAATETLESLDEELLLLHERAEQLAGELLAQRTESGDRFGRAVAAQFSRVALANALFDVRVSGPDGSSVEFLFAASSDGVPGPLHSLASGGELARVLLAISLETVSEGVVAVFDEIDAGVGGAVAQQIGECLRELSTRQQVIVVTHLASIAAKADRQFVVEKISTSVVATTTVRVVEGEDRVSEIARMLAGESDLRESRALAQRLLSDH